MTTTVEPAEFSYVDFDARCIAELADELAAAIGLEGDIRIEVDETQALGHTELTSVDPLVLATESGALEDPKRLRKFSHEIATDVLGRHLLRAKDRRNPDFGEPDGDDTLAVPHRVAWEIHTIGRLSRMGYPANRQRWLYAFRNRHGFTDAADQAFETLWHTESMTWADITDISDRTAAQNPGTLDRKPA
ncbi:MAG: hypothetical protein ACSLFO_04525 [Acidimicrobiales bacterium]